MGKDLLCQIPRHFSNEFHPEDNIHSRPTLSTGKFEKEVGGILSLETQNQCRTGYGTRTYYYYGFGMMEG